MHKMNKLIGLKVAGGIVKSGQFTDQVARGHWSHNLPSGQLVDWTSPVMVTIFVLR